MAQLELALLGTPEINIDGAAVKSDRRKVTALLAYLAVTGKGQTRDHLAGLLWPDYPQDSAYAYLRRTLWELNQVLGKGWIEADGDTLVLRSYGTLKLDTTAFEEKSRADLSSTTALSEAAALYRGDFMEGFRVADTAPFEDWQTQQTAYFRRQLAVVLEKLVNAHDQAGKHSLGLPYAQRWLDLDLLNETAHCAVMRLLARMGDRTGAIRQYESCVSILKAELGIPPQADTTRCYEAILRGEMSAAPAEVVTTAATVAVPRTRGLPVMPTPFIGRRSEVEQIKGLVQNPTNRLITLSGPGGTGKTRLAIQAASELSEDFPDGVVVVLLAAVSSAETVLPALAKAMDFSFYREERPHQQMLDYLREKRLLIVLDNFEHLLGASGLVTDILTNTPGVKVLVTSRVRLNVQGEQLYPVGGMRLPDAKEAAEWKDPEAQSEPFSAVQLFLDRARRVQPGFMLTGENLKEVLEICRLVQGLPLGLELAASWLALLPPDEIAREIARSLDFLETSHTDVPKRQRSIRAVFESSWKLLSQEEQQAMRHLCVFMGSFTRDAAQQVSAASLRTLLGLVNKSWLQQTGSGRFQLHEILHHYGLEQLASHPDELREVHDRHAAYYASFIAEQTQRMRTSEQLAALNAVDEEFNSNLKAAWDWLVTGQRWDELINPFAVGLFMSGSVHEQLAVLIPWLRKARMELSAGGEIRHLLAFTIISTLEIYCEANEQIEDTHPLERLVAVWHMTLEHQLAEPMGLWFVLLASLVNAFNLDPNAQEQLDEAVRRLRKENDPWNLGFALLMQSDSKGVYYLDEEKLLEAAQIFRTYGGWYEKGLTAELLARHAIQQKRPLSDIMGHFQQAKQYFKQLGEESRAIFAFMHLAALYFREGLVEQGFTVHHETQQTLERVGNIRMLAASLHWESLSAVRYSTFEHAVQTQERSLALYRQVNNQSEYCWGLFELGDIYRVFGDPGKAAELYEEAYPGFKSLNMILALGFYERAYGDLAFEAGRYTEALARYEQFAQYVSWENHNWSMAQARARRALTLAYLENREAARHELQAVLREICNWGEDELVYMALLAEPVCLMQEGRCEEAVGLAAFINSHPVAWNETKLQARKIIQEAARSLTEEAAQAAIEAGKGLSRDAVVAGLIDRAVPPT